MYYVPAAPNDNSNSNQVPNNLDGNLAMALRISEQERQQIEDDLKQEEEMIAEALRRSLEEK